MGSPNKDKFGRDTIHAKRLKELRRYVNFDYDLRKPLSRYAKRKIFKYHEEFQELTARPFKIFRPRKKQNLKNAQKISGHTGRNPGFKVALLPVAPNKGVKITVKKDYLAVKYKYAVKYVVALNKKALALDSENEIKRVISKMPRKARLFTIGVGAHFIDLYMNEAKIIERVKQLIERYAVGKPDPRDKTRTKFITENNSWDVWLNTINGHEFRNQERKRDFIIEERKARKKHQQRRAKVRKAARRKKRG